MSSCLFAFTSVKIAAWEIAASFEVLSNRYITIVDATIQPCEQELAREPVLSAFLSSPGENGVNESPLPRRTDPNVSKHFPSSGRVAQPDSTIVVPVLPLARQ